jgi:hypothetical protein
MCISRTIKQLIVGSTLCLALLPLHAATVDDGFDATRHGDYSSALEFWQERASSGDAQAQFNLALMYHGGLGVKPDESQALQWYQKAAQNGYPWAQEYLAIGYQEGWFGLERDRKKAKSWFKQLENKSYF